MADRVVLHIGPRKTATTYLQRALQRLVEDGDLSPDLYPVRTRGRLDHNQVPGLIDLARSLGEIALQDDAWRQQDGSYAEALREHVRRADGTVILSAEALSVMRDSGARAVVEAFAPARVEVIVTLRDIARILPSSWQQHVRNGNIEDYPTYLSLREEERVSGAYLTDVGRAFWRAYRYGDLVRRWQVAAHSVSIVTVPASSQDPAEVWRRFRAASALERELPEAPPEVPADVANISLTGPETYALHGFNLAARDVPVDMGGTGGSAGRREVRSVHRQLIRLGWAQRPDRGPRLGIPADFYPVVVGWAGEDLHDLSTCSAPVFGTLADLEVPDSLESGTRSGSPTGTAGRASPLSPAAWPTGQRAGLPDPEAVADAAGAALALLHHARTPAAPVAGIDIRGMDPDD